MLNAGRPFPGPLTEIIPASAADFSVFDSYGYVDGLTNQSPLPRSFIVSRSRRSSLHGHGRRRESPTLFTLSAFIQVDAAYAAFTERQ